jgi:hypothetical protein
MCFLPKSRESMDQAPGPIIAKAAPSTACITAIHGSPECERSREKATHRLTMAAKDPVTGVHRPTRRSNPAPAPMTSSTAVVNGGAWRRPTIAKRISANPVSSRRSRRPMPGQPSANVEKSRCNPHLFQRMRFATVSKHAKLGTDYPLFGGSTVQ